MPYNAKTNWQHDEVVTEADLNRIEQGVADATTAAEASHTAAEAAQSAADTAQTAANNAQATADAAGAAAATAQDEIDAHEAATAVHGATSAATASRIMTRDGAGRAKVAAPFAADDIARKDTVDNAIATAVLKGTADTDLQQLRSVFVSTNDCTLEATSWDSKNRVLAYALKSGATTVATMTYTRDVTTGLVMTATIKNGAGATIQAYQYNWDGKRFLNRTPI